MAHLFDPEVVHECALAGLGKDKPAMFDAIAGALDAKYPGRIDRGQPWIFSNAGGAMIQMKLYYASVFEYLMIWGTPIGSEGHSGRHAVGFWDTVIDGEMWYYGEGQFDKRTYRPADRVYVGPGQARAMNFTDGVWAVEYARGPLPLSVPFGVADELLSTLDFRTAGQTLSIYLSLVGHHWRLPHADGSVPSFARTAVGGVLGAVGSMITRVLRPAEPDDEIPTGRTGTSPASTPIPGRRLTVAEGAAASRRRRGGSAARG
jgi:ERG2 and Sigma1 receptor like protein